MQKKNTKHTCSWTLKLPARYASITLASISLYNNQKAELLKIPISQHFYFPIWYEHSRFLVAICPLQWDWYQFFLHSLQHYCNFSFDVSHPSCTFHRVYYHINFFQFVLKHPCSHDICHHLNFKILIIKYQDLVWTFCLFSQWLACTCSFAFTFKRTEVA